MEHASGSRVESYRESPAQRHSRGATVHSLAPRVSSPCPEEATFVQEN
jgi:hypothetical protein